MSALAQMSEMSESADRGCAEAAGLVTACGRYSTVPYHSPNTTKKKAPTEVRAFL